MLKVSVNNYVAMVMIILRILNAEMNVSLPIVPALSVDITSTGISTDRQNYSLTCDTNGVGLLNISNREYQWRKNGYNISSSPFLKFTPLNLNDSGNYTCTVNIISPLLNDTHTAMNRTAIIIISKL